MIVLYGATGVTGSLIARELVDRGLPLVLSGRDRGRLTALAGTLGAPIDVRPAGVHAPGELAAAFAGARLVISCAGPFLLVGEPVLRAALEAGAHYLDTTGEQAFLRDSYERHDSRARHAGLAAVPSFAFEVVLGDLAASVAGRRARALAGAGEDEPVDEIVVGYAVQGMSATAGTLESMVTTAAQPGLIWYEDRWERAAPASRTRSLRFPEPFGEQQSVLFPSGEVVTVPRHLAARRVEAYLAVASATPMGRLVAQAAGVLGPLLPALAASPLGALARARMGATPRPSAEARAATRFALVVEATMRFRRARVAITGRDPYGLTARIAALGAQVLLGAAPRQTGVLAPAQLVDPAETLAALAGEDLITVEES